MALMTWTTDFSVQVDAIDKQHQRLIALINELHDAMLSGTTRDSIGYILTSLIDYTKSHFAYEEDLFEHSSYPDAEAHKAAHAALTDKVLALQSSYAAGEAVMGMEVMAFLKDWLTGHIMGTDKKYMPYLAPAETK